MSSRFFRGGNASDSDSDDDSILSSSEDESQQSENENYSSEEESEESEEESSEEESEEESEDETDSDETESESEDEKKPMSRFLRGGDSSDESDSEDEEKKVVKSAKEKKLDELKDITVNINTNLESLNWAEAQSEYDKLTKAVQKAANIIKEGVPVFITATLVKLDDKIKNTTNQEIKNLNKLNARSFNAIKQNIKKFTKQFEKQMNEYRLNGEPQEAKDEINDDNDGFQKVTKMTRSVKKIAAAEAAVSREVKLDESKDSFSVVGKGGKIVQITTKNLFEKLNEIINTRGKKGTNKSEQSDILKKMLNICNTPYQKVKVLLVLIPFQFDYVSGIGNSLSIEIWKSVTNYFNNLLTILEENENIIVKEISEEKNAEDAEKSLAEGNEIIVAGSINSFIDRIDEEFTRSLQNIDPHTTEYIERMKDEQILYELIVRTQIYLERIKNNEKIPSLLIRRIEHIYYKPINVINVLEENIRKNETIAKTKKIDTERLVYELCIRIYKVDDERLRSHALLYHIYHDALHDKYNSARDLLLMSHIQEHVTDTDISTQIIYNRAIVQLGLCAFRCGMIKESNQCLQEIQNTQKVKELLAQGVQQQRYSDKTPEQEKKEKQRLLPFHMHINLELLECIYLTCSMLLEIPSMAANVYNSRKVIISYVFRKMLDINERQVFLGPPENTREHIMGASKALAAGEWQKCRDLIMAIKIWDLMPNTEEIKKMLTKKIQEEGLRTWIFVCRNHYDNVSLEQLATMFELPINEVHSIISKMIINEELSATIDETTSIVVMSKSELNKLQYLSVQYSEKISKFVENNEKLLEQRSSEITSKRSEKDQKGGYQNQNKNYRTNRNYQNRNDRNRNYQRKQHNNNTTANY